MDTSVSQKLKSSLSMAVLPGICLALFFLVGYHIDRIIKDADAATMRHQEGPEPHAAIVSAHAAPASATTQAEHATESKHTLQASHPN